MPWFKVRLLYRELGFEQETVQRLHPFDWTYRVQAADERAAVRQAAREFEQMQGLSGAGWVREVVGVEVLPAEGPAERPSTEAEGDRP
jgi:hypothetical protein